MKKKVYVLRFEEPISNEYLENFLRTIFEITSEFCSVEYTIQKKIQLKNKNVRSGNGLDPWL